ncbi:MAG: HNH endonuclease, partial [Planctomycetes bacterium RBG_16_55_9]
MAKKKRKQQQVELPEEFLKKVKSVTAKRAKTVIDHILEHGYITTEELSDKYGYDHPPRAARDVREQGIPLETFRITSTHGRNIGAYKFGDPAKIKGGKLRGRIAWPKNFKEQLVETNGVRCASCFTEYELRYLQIDHRVPYQVGGDPQGDLNPFNFMLLCGSCNRAKSWSCEHCRNWKQDKLVNVCNTCYWASPANYAHIALRLIRRLDITWTGNEVPEYDQL